MSDFNRPEYQFRIPEELRRNPAMDAFVTCIINFDAILPKRGSGAAERKKSPR
jgi:hypothetical protein